MKIILASDSFKGSLSSERIVELLKQVIGEVFSDVDTDGMLVADGGEGTMDLVVKELKGSYREIEAENPLGQTIRASYGLLPDSLAIIEMAAASGLPLVDAKLRNPLKTSTYGTGMLIRDALDQGVRKIVIAIGGSATNDGGMGAMSALGVRFLDENGNLLKGCGEELSRVHEIDISQMYPAVSKTIFTVMCDVTNPLLGKNGATYTFGMQKGADPAMLEVLEAGMEHYASVMEKKFGTHAALESGAGAAGGLGFALLAFLHAELKPGIETVLDMLHFDERLKGADLVITGEGRMDWQSSFGKVPSGVGKRCQKAGIPAVAIVGGLLDGYQEIYKSGICSIATTVNGIMELDDAIQRSEELYKDAAYRLLNAVKCGMEMHSDRSRNIHHGDIEK
jgi:glycerate kinase